MVSQDWVNEWIHFVVGTPAMERAHWNVRWARQWGMREVSKWMLVGLLCGSVMIEVMAAPSSARERSPHLTMSPSAVRVANNVEKLAPSNGAAAAPSAGGTAQSEPVPVQESKPQGEAQGFTVDRYIVEGNTILLAEQIGPILDKYKRGGLTFKEIEQARTELEKAYHAAGYPTVLVTIPEQTVDHGTVQFNVFEGRLGAIAVGEARAILYEPTFLKELSAANGNPDEGDDGPIEDFLKILQEVAWAFRRAGRSSV